MTCIIVVLVYSCVNVIVFILWCVLFNSRNLFLKSPIKNVCFGLAISWSVFSLGFWNINKKIYGWIVLLWAKPLEMRVLNLILFTVWCLVCLGSLALGYCHTLISSGDHFFMACNLCLTASRNLTPIVKQSVKFLDMSGVERKHYYVIRKVP